MKKKALLILIVPLILLSGTPALHGADIEGKVTLSPKGTPYSHGNILLMSRGAENYIKTTIDPRGNFIYRDLEAGKYVIKMDLYGLTPVEKEIEIKGDEEVLKLDLTISLSLLDKALVFIREVSDFMWSSWMIALLLGTGILLTFLTRMIQVRRLLLSLKMVLQGALRKDKSEKGEGDISPYAALMTALAATVGNGNIAGVATAIATGGPGAPVWMWTAGFFGGEWPQNTQKASWGLNSESRTNGAKCPGVPCTTPAAVLITLSWPSSWACSSLSAAPWPACSAQATWPSPTPWHSLSTTSSTFPSGSAGWPSQPLSERSFSAASKGSGAIVVMLANITNLPAALAVIFKSAFSIKAVGGALVGTSVRQAVSIGIRRGLLSNESGLGSAAIAQASSRSTDPSRNGLIAMTGTFIDTMVVNTLTTLTIVMSGVYLKTAAFGASEGLTSTSLTAAAFNSVIPFGGYIIAVSSFLFGYSTLLGWCYYGEKCLEYIFGVRIIFSYRVLFIALLFIGSIIQGVHLNIVWYVGDTANALMAFPNLISLVLLSGLVGKTTTDYFYKKKKSISGIPNA